MYTSDKDLTIDDLGRLRDQYNCAGEFADMSFMHELFHGLDNIIANDTRAKQLLSKVVNCFGRGVMRVDSVTLRPDSPIIEEIKDFLGTQPPPRSGDRA